MWRQAFTPEMIRAWFIEAGNGHRVEAPAIEACKDLAQRVSLMRSLGRPPKLTDVLGDIRKHGRLFLLHLDKSHTRLPEILHPAQQDLAPKILARIDKTRDEVKDAIEALLNDFPEGRWGGDWSWEPWALEIRDLASSAWATVNIRPPASKLATQPLSKFVAKALSEIGEPRTPEAISKALKSRKTTVGLGTQSKSHFYPYSKKIRL